MSIKRFLLIITLSIVGHTALATEWLTYYVYIQKQYLQGPWTRASLMDTTGNYDYLHPKEIVELFGWDENGQYLAEAIMHNLKEETPPRYSFQYNLFIKGDTAVIQTNDSIKEYEAVKNECTASFLMNKFKVLNIIHQGISQMYTMSDITVPYMDLIVPTPPTRSTSLEQPLNHEPDLSEPSKENQKESTFNLWLIISVVINIILFVILLLRRKRSQEGI